MNNFYGMGGQPFGETMGMQFTARIGAGEEQHGLARARSPEEAGEARTDSRVHLQCERGEREAQPCEFEVHDGFFLSRTSPSQTAPKASITDSASRTHAASSRPSRTRW